MDPRPDRDSPQVGQAADVLDVEALSARTGIPVTRILAALDAADRMEAEAETDRAEAGEPLLGVEPEFHPAGCTCDDHGRPR